MKKLPLILLAVLLPIGVYSAKPETSYPILEQKSRDSFSLDSIQSKIFSAFLSDIMSQTNAEMSFIGNKLDDLSKQKPNSVISYWQAYLQFYQGIYYLKVEHAERCKNEFDKGISILTNLKNKNTEDYALLARLQGISMRFAGMNAPSLAQEMSSNAKKAIELDPDNLRANLIYASNDYYTPAIFGGGKDAEKYLLKAISLPEQKVVNTYMPSWGKDEAYEMLIKLYLMREDKASAKKYYDEAIKLYPGNFILKQLESQFM